MMIMPLVVEEELKRNGYQDYIRESFADFLYWRNGKFVGSGMLDSNRWMDGSEGAYD